MASLEELNPDKSLNIIGLTCPFALIKVKKALRGMDSNEVLEVWTDHRPAALTSIPNFCRLKNYKCEVIEEEEEESLWRVIIII